MRERKDAPGWLHRSLLAAKNLLDKNYGVELDKDHFETMLAEAYLMGATDMEKELVPDFVSRGESECAAAGEDFFGWEKITP